MYIGVCFEYMKCTAEETKAWIEKYASKKGYVLNSDEEMLGIVIDGLTRNRNELGRQYCPCRLVMGNEEDKKIICPCVFHEEEIESNGSCHCNLFFK